jgi:hypothetical protein
MSFADKIALSLIMLGAFWISAKALWQIWF